jgi:hypothetical protein
LRPLPVIPVAPTYVVANVAIDGSSEWAEILTPSGRIVARTEINPSQGPVSGTDGVYWTENGAEYVLTPAGALRKLGLVPSDAGGVVIGPDGISYAYPTSEPLKSNPEDPLFANEITVVHPGSPDKVIGDVVGSANDAYSQYSGGWSYSLESWTNSGIGFVRQPEGMCGCGGFELQMQSAYSAIIDPVSGGETTMTASSSCPLSDLGPALESVCFEQNSGGATDEMRIATAGTVTHTYTLSGKNAAGDAMFNDDGSQIAYVTIPVTEDQCGETITGTLRVMDLASGHTIRRAMGDFAPAAWTAGLIYGTVTNDTTGAQSVVSVNPATLAVTRLSPSGDSAGVIGVI